jgi:hypothetical protein
VRSCCHRVGENKELRVLEMVLRSDIRLRAEDSHDKPSVQSKKHFHRPPYQHSSTPEIHAGQMGP